MLKKIIFFSAISLLLWGGLQAQAQSSLHYSITLSQSGNGWKTSKRAVLSGSYNQADFALGKAVLYSFSGEKLAENGLRLLDKKGEYFLELPYFENGKEVKILESNNEVYQFSVANFAKTCPNGTCEEHESFAICPDDCPSGRADGYCDAREDGICDPDCQVKKYDEDCPEGQYQNSASNQGEVSPSDGSSSQNSSRKKSLTKSLSENPTKKSVSQPSKDNIPHSSSQKTASKQYALPLILGGLFIIIISVVYWALKRNE